MASVATLMMFAFGGAASAETSQWSAAASTATDAAVAQMMDAQHVRGMSVTVAHAGTILYAKGYGLRDIATSEPVDAGTVFPIGSITKTFTAAAIGQLIDRGMLSLDERVATILPNAPHATDITIRQLLQQTSGLPDFVAAAGFTVLADKERPSTALLLDLLGSRPLLFAPGTRFAYSNTNYLILGAIIEKRSGMPYERYIAQRIAAPADASSISYGVPSSGDVARGYDLIESKPVVPWSAEALRGAGALAAAPLDIIRFDEAFFGGRIVSGPTMALLTTPPILPAQESSDYAGGWIAGALYGHRMLWHSGGVPGANTRNVVFPDDRLEVVLFANRIIADNERVLRTVARAYFRPNGPQLAAQRQADEAPKSPEDASITAIAKRELGDWTAGTVDRGHYTYPMRLSINDAQVQKVGTLLARLGEPLALRFVGRSITNDQTLYQYRLLGPSGALDYTLGLEASGRIKTMLFSPPIQPYETPSP